MPPRSYVLLPSTPELLLVEDARTDARFSANVYVAGEPGIRFYAGAPLVGSDGHRYGTLCLTDLRPRRFSPEMLLLLVNFAELVVRQLEQARWPAPAAPPSCRPALGPGEAAPPGSDAAGLARHGLRSPADMAQAVALLDVSQGLAAAWPILYSNDAWRAATGQGAAEKSLDFWRLFSAGGGNKASDLCLPLRRSLCIPTTTFLVPTSSLGTPLLPAIVDRPRRSRWRTRWRPAAQWWQRCSSRPAAQQCSWSCAPPPGTRCSSAYLWVSELGRRAGGCVLGAVQWDRGASWHRHSADGSADARPEPLPLFACCPLQAYPTRQQASSLRASRERSTQQQRQPSGLLWWSARTAHPRRLPHPRCWGVWRCCSRTASPAPLLLMMCSWVRCSDQEALGAFIEVRGGALCRVDVGRLACRHERCWGARTHAGTYRGAPVAVKVVESTRAALTSATGPLVEAALGRGLSHAHLVQTLEYATYEEQVCGGGGRAGSAVCSHCWGAAARAAPTT